MICLLWVKYCMWVIQHVASLYLLWPTFWMHYFVFSWCTFSYLFLHLQILVLLLWAGTVNAAKEYSESHQHTRIQTSTPPHTHTHSCIHNEIVEQQRRSGVNLYKITPQVSTLVRGKGCVLWSWRILMTVVQCHSSANLPHESIWGWWMSAFGNLGNQGRCVFSLWVFVFAIHTRIVSTVTWYILFRIYDT